jgi:DNA-directed RNA polymerase specialized sigma24 family protein
VRKDDTNLKPRTNDGVFATTHWSVVVSAGQSGSEAAFVALDRLCQAYWYPLFAYLRQRGYTEDQAKDLTQAFFAQLIRHNFLSAADPTRGRFRTFLLTALNHFLANEWNRGQTQKRGGGVEFILLDYVREQEDRSLDIGHDLTPERIYEKRWAEAVLAKVLERLRSEFDGASIKRFDELKQFLTEEKGASSYANAAQALGMTSQAVKSAVHRLRQRWQELVREEIAHTVHAATSRDVDDEIRYLLNVLT